MSKTELDDFVERAARLLSKSRAPVIAGLGADMAGLVAAFRLAEKLGCAIDHAGADYALRDQAVLQTIGLMLVSPGEARRRADVVLVVGDRPMQAQPDLADLLLTARSAGAANASDGARGRRVIALASHAPKSADATHHLAATPFLLPGVLAALRARVNGHPVAAGYDVAELDRAAEAMKAAAFGVAIWSPEELDALTIEMLVGMVQDLNAGTRWSGLSVSADPTLAGAAMASGFVAGVPLRCGYGRSRPEHDPWRFDAKRLVESGEADAVLWASAFEAAPDWVRTVPSVVLGENKAEPGEQTVALAVGRPGRDHDGILHDACVGALVDHAAEEASPLPSIAEVLTRIAVRLGEQPGAP